ncbi:MAG: hypothetical protein EXS32_12075 [Opitutus sp.]|nr:hypothetical protein [Opitutus sp.]
MLRVLLRFLALAATAAAADVKPGDVAFGPERWIEYDAGNLHARFGGSGAALIRGPRSLGDLFEQRGIRAVPSPQEPPPAQTPFFSGGYIVRRHAAAPATTKVDGVQIECYRGGLRDTAVNRTRFAKTTAEVLTVFLHERYHYDFPGQSGPDATNRK